MRGTWKTIKSKVVFNSNRFGVREDDVIRPDGSKAKFYYRFGNPSVIIIAFDGKKITLVNQYRYVQKKRLWELPIGKSENHNYLQQAKKELREETGIRAKKWKFVGEFYPSPGSQDSCGKIFLAKDLEYGAPEREAGEKDMYTAEFSIKQIDKMIAVGKIVDGWTITSMHLFKLKILNNS